MREKNRGFRGFFADGEVGFKRRGRFGCCSDFQGRQADQYQSFTPQSLVPSTDAGAAALSDFTGEAGQSTALSPSEP